MISGSLAKRYARALLHLADNAMKRDKFDKDMFAFADLMEQRGDDGNPVWAVLETSYYPLAERKSLIQTFGKRLGTDATVLTFLELVMERGRMSGVGQIARHFREMADHLLFFCS